MTTPQAGTASSTALVQAPARAPLAPVEAGAAALTAQVEARIKAQFFLARQFPRNWLDVRSRLLEAFARPILAEGAIYAKPIGDKKVEGLSIRFAEEAFRAMGNVTVETMLVSDDEDKRVYTVTGTDMETLASLPVSVVVTKQMERASTKAGDVILAERTNSRGLTTYVIKARSEDDYRSKEQALLQKARRDVILFLTPGDIKEECEAKIRQTVKNRDKADPQGAINRVAKLFYGVGVTTAEIEKFLGHPLAAMNEAELHVLRSLYNAIKEGEGTWADVIEAKLGTNTGADEPKGAGAKLGDLLKNTKKATEELAGAMAAAAAPASPAMLEYTRRRIVALLTQEARGTITAEDAEELRQLRMDSPELFPLK